MATSQACLLLQKQLKGREMKIRFCSGFTKPGFLLVHFEPPSFFSVRSRSLSDPTYGNLCNHKKRPGKFGLTVQCAIANRRFSSRSVDSFQKENFPSSDLCEHPVDGFSSSLVDEKNICE